MGSVRAVGNSHLDGWGGRGSSQLFHSLTQNEVQPLTIQNEPKIGKKLLRIYLIPYMSDASL